MKSYYFDAEGTAAIAYCTRLGFAVVSGDPIGTHNAFPKLVSDFAAMCNGRGWRIIVLGCGERWLALWRNAGVTGQPLRPVPIGRDVAVDVSRFDMVGRKYRNLRQAVQRTHNAGITTQVVSEQDLDSTLAGELAEVLNASHRGAHVERGFSMILDHALEGRYPGIKLIIARDRYGRVQAFHRYATAGEGSDVTLDVPWRRPGAPNGIDERLSGDMITYTKERGGKRLSVAFAAFPEIFDNNNRSLIESVYYGLIHLDGSLIRLESLYRKPAQVRLVRSAPLCAVVDATHPGRTGGSAVAGIQASAAASAVGAPETGTRAAARKREQRTFNRGLSAPDRSRNNQ
jgi:lysylphosphatidylglycerol synthetase-like protein (DUF2156 family)